MEQKTTFELLVEAGKAITSELDLAKVVQRVTDIATEITGAQFGAFFYNVINKQGESYVLYTISGVEREAFSKFPMPRNTKIFEPTFMARGTVRYDDVTMQPHYGQNPPYYGMPKGHLPVRSYLAVPVVSPINGEPIGGLFFGHAEAGRFTETAEKLAEGIAVQAGIALMNAKLFEDKKHIEETLVEQREQYKSIFSAVSDSIMIYNSEGFIVEANPAASRTFGYSYEELVGKPAASLFLDPQDFNALREIALSGRQFKGITKRKKKDGTLFEAQSEGTLFMYKGRPHVLSVISGEAARIKSEELLQQREEFASVITNISPLVLWMVNEKGGATFFNQTWLDWVGGTLEEHLGLGWVRSVYEEDREQILSDFAEAFKNRKMFTADFRIVRRGGEIRWCSSHGSPYFNRHGEFAGFAGSLNDITDRKLSEQQLQRQHLLINTISNNTRQALFLTDEFHYCTFMNPAAEKMTGFKLHELRKRPLHYYIHHTRPDGTHYPLDECPMYFTRLNYKRTEGEELFIKKSGEFYPVYFVASPIVEQGVFKGTVIEAQDITEKKQIEELLRDKEKQAMAMLEEMVKERTRQLEKTNYELMQFTSVASHDLKEPVRKIAIFSGMLRNSLGNSLSPVADKHLNSINVSATRMVKLIDDLLTFSRLSQDNDTMEPCDLQSLLQLVIENLEVRIQEKQATVDADKLPVVNGVSFKLIQVFQNLLSNSLKFSAHDRPPHITITSQRVDDAHVHGYKICYKDNGIGFSSDQASRIFDVFYRLHPRSQYEGTGIGLAIVKKIMDEHGGTITAQGYPDIGAEFVMFFPDA